MNSLECFPEARLYDSSFSPPYSIQNQEQELAIPRQEIDGDDMARLPRIPPITDDYPRTMSLQELWDWRTQWEGKRRPPTRSERLDFSECGRQINDLISETTMDWEEDEEDINTRKPPLSPPPTPPHLRGPKLYKHQHVSPAPYPGSSRIQKTKRNNHCVTRRPITRTSNIPPISLHHRRGQVLYWHTVTEYVVVSYKQYLRDYDREELDKLPPAPPDFSREDSTRPHKTDYQREVCRRWTAQSKQLESAVLIPWTSWKGHK